MAKHNTKIWLFILPLVVFGGFVFMLAGRIGQTPEITTNTALYRPLPSFQLPLLSDTTRQMSNADLPKHAYILNVWGSWCPTCRVEHPFLVQLAAEGVPIVGVNYKDELSDALGYLASGGDPYLYSLQDKAGDLALDLGLMGAPESFIVDGEGRVRLHIVGELHEGNWTTSVKPCLQALDNPALDEATKDSACKAQVGGQ